MGEIKIKIELENFVDRFLFLEKKAEESEIRSRKIDAIVDTGAVMLSLTTGCGGRTWFGGPPHSCGNLRG